MAQPTPDRRPGNLRLRLLSALVFAPPFCAAVYFGTPWFDAVVVLAGSLMTWEWARICCDNEFSASGFTLLAGTFAVIGAYYFVPVEIVLAVVIVAGVAAVLFGRLERRACPPWLAAGAILIGIFSLSFLWIRDFPESGREHMIWLVFAVWFTDTGGYFFGRSIGGPKLAPVISPNKTWAGLGGGMVLATVWSVYWLPRMTETAMSEAIAAGIGIAVLAQVGDLTVSAVKRRFGVKDSSGLIPGHGGVLDRLDGMLLTAPVTAFVLFWAGRGLN